MVIADAKVLADYIIYDDGPRYTPDESLASVPNGFNLTWYINGTPNGAPNGIQDEKSGYSRIIIEEI